jgi:hypothetical protein
MATKLLWSELNNLDQEKFIEQAMTLINRGYVDNSTNMLVLAKRIYESRK